MIKLNRRETLFLKGIKFHRVYKNFKHEPFEEFYSKFKGRDTYQYKSIIMTFYAMYGANYSVDEAEYIIYINARDLAFKLFINDDLDFHSLLGKLRIAPVGIISQKKYFKEIDLDEI